MIARYRTEESRELANTIYMLRQEGLSLTEVARYMGIAYPNVVYRYRRECIFREQAFYYPFIEYITPRTEKVIRKSIGEEILAEPEHLNTLESIRILLFWPGVSTGILADLAEGLTEAGYESFDPDQIMDDFFNPKKRCNQFRQ